MERVLLRYFLIQVYIDKLSVMAISDAQGIHRAAEKTDWLVFVLIAD